jgi:hypothetical protein
MLKNRLLRPMAINLHSAIELAGVWFFCLFPSINPLVYLFTIFVVNISFLPFYFEPCLPPIVICSMKDEIDQHYLSNIIVCK